MDHLISSGKRQAFDRLDNHNIAIATVSGSLAKL